MTVALALLLVSISPVETPYHWPLDLPKQLTSSFAEYRPGRFHAGIDLRTGGIGLPVHAADDGYVSRIRCSPFGYGKAVYLTLDDGNTVVYGHLDDYADDIRAYVRSKQHAAQSYTVDLYCEPGQFSVKRGQIIAKSGQTGIGAPHLHYEIRDIAQQPINPRLLGIAWPDGRAPELRKLVVAPLDASARVNGKSTPAIIDLTHVGNGRYRAGTVRAAGRVGFGVDLVDADGGYRLGVHEMRLNVDGQERFVMRHDLLSYENHRNAAVAYHPHLLSQGRFLLLWRWPGNVCPSYTVTRDDGVVDLDGEEHEIEITATDFMGNDARLSLTTEPDNGQRTDEPAADGGVHWTCLDEGFEVSLGLPQGNGKAPRFLLMTDGKATEIPAAPVGNGYVARIAPERGGAYTLRVEHPAIDTYEAPLAAMRRGEPAMQVMLGDVGLRMEPDAAYGLLMARAYPSADVRDAPIPRHGTAYRVWPDTMPVDTPVEVSLPLPGGITDPGKVDVYRAGRGWSPEGARLRDGRLYFETRSFGAFAVLEDNQPPSLSDVLPREGYHSKTRRPLIQATISDVGSGIDTIDVRCDDTWLLVAYDPERRHIAWERDEELTPGEHKITFTITDNAGNITTRTRTLVVP